MNSHVFDSVFRTLAQKTPYLFIELINEAFGTEYTRKTKPEQLRNEFYEKGGKVVTDSVYRIGRHLYHLECQSTQDGKMVLRMFQYDFYIAIEQAAKNNQLQRVELPRSCVIYLRSTRNTPEVLRTELVQGDRTMVYESQVIRLSDYTMDKIFGKNLIVLIPFYLLRYEKDFKKNQINAETSRELIEDCKEIAITMRENETITEQEYIDVMDAFGKVTNYVLRKHQKAKEEVKRVMGGEIYETASEKLIKKGRKEGRAEGRAEGERDTLISLFTKGVITDEQASEQLGVSVDDFRGMLKKTK